MDVMCAFLNYYQNKLESGSKSSEEKTKIEQCIDVFATHRFNKKMIKEHIIPNEKEFGKFRPCCGSGIAYFNYFPKSWFIR